MLKKKNDKTAQKGKETPIPYNDLQVNTNSDHILRNPTFMNLNVWTVLSLLLNLSSTISYHVAYMVWDDETQKLYFDDSNIDLLMFDDPVLLLISIRKETMVGLFLHHRRNKDVIYYYSMENKKIVLALAVALSEHYKGSYETVSYNKTEINTNGDDSIALVYFFESFLLNKKINRNIDLQEKRKIYSEILSNRSIVDTKSLIIDLKVNRVN